MRIVRVLAGGVLAIWLAIGAAAARPALDFVTPGADNTLREAIRSASLLVQTWQAKSDDPQEILAAAQADYARILGLLYSSAHYGGVITIRLDGQEAASIPPLYPPKRVARITLRVDPGPVYRFSVARIHPLAPGTRLPDGFARGQPGSTDTIRTAADAATTAWRDAGHAKAKVADQKITATFGSRSVAADLTIAPGPELSFGRVTVTGNRKVRAGRVTRIAGLPEGARFDPAEIARAEKRLRRTGSFRSAVITEADAPAPDGSLPMTIQVSEMPPRRFGFGAAVSSIDGLTLNGFWLHRNLLGGAERLRIDGEVAGIGGTTGGTDYTLSARLDRPATPSTDIDGFLAGTLENLNEPDYSSKSAEVVLGFTRYASDAFTMDAGVGLRFSKTRDALGEETSTLVTLPLGAVYDKRDNALDPKKGYFAEAHVTPFYGLSGAANGVQSTLDTRLYRSFGAGERVTLAGRLQLGSVAGPSLADAPAFYLFRSGGGGTVRGQPYQSLAVDLGGGNTIGGRSFLGLSGEVRVAATDSIGIVGFFDYGYIGAESFPDGSGGHQAGAGLGLRYNTGIGPIRVDVAVPVGGTGSGYAIYVGIGQAF